MCIGSLRTYFSLSELKCSPSLQVSPFHLAQWEVPSAFELVPV